MRYPSGVDRCEDRLRTFESEYGMTSAEFLQRYENDELPETLELGEWIGEIKMLQRLQDKAARSTHPKLSLNSRPRRMDRRKPNDKMA